MSKSILITGKHGYVGNRLEQYLTNQDYLVESISVRGNEWKHLDFGKFDVIIHLAALVHNNEPNAKMVDYMNVNYHLTRELAEKAKTEGTKQFIFFSTMSVFGVEGKIGENITIDRNTAKKPTTEYGISKLRAEEKLYEMKSSKFKIAVVRPPMIYGSEAPGNFHRLIQVSKLLPLYPQIDNQRSSIYIENLEIYIGELIQKESSGTFHPQNQYYLNTNVAIVKMRELNNKNSKILKLPSSLIKLFSKVSFLNKIYGNLVYDHNIDSFSIEEKFINEDATYSRTILN
ncbi:NAD-dependent epimerase/dehydratase family protein [Mammaliicoccus sp. Dog046]|uniref:NAD-dependent epimerase/dehydratase family protein n=1 Tax=Mammaliicoccus sp. Dog046 TaxID=3034233 RepID=UPI002B258555|nr:NAD-dependent epimerase/dehydratase family protein [Mammaliicoccus sp. Dog046]WQK85142.1 NAD-dependent epimerase/dehydratase family protein [Mammaliicoccus sp. Dog046]